MFYSHEILSNNQYGVSTIWLVATVGKSNHRRLTRKAIQEVNVPKACEKIIDPGAPLALRLQGNLLYGLSRVFAQQCHYVLSDAEKTQSDMLMFFRIMNTSELDDPRAGKAKHHQITLQDDPNFDIANVPPNFHLFSSNKELFFGLSQGSALSLSQLTPLTQRSLSSGSNPQLLPFDLSQSSISAPNRRLRSDLGQNSPLPKRINLDDQMDLSEPFEEGFDPFAGLGLDIDADGNIVAIANPEPELPPLPGVEAQEVQTTGVTTEKKDDKTGGLEGENVSIVEEEPLPDAKPFAKSSQRKKTSPSDTLSSESTVSERVVTHLQRKRPRKAPQLVDEIDQVSRDEFVNWSKKYLEKMDEFWKRPRTTAPAQARKNAVALLFNDGIAGVGAFHGFNEISHPLVKEFAGATLQAKLQGKFTGDDKGPLHSQRRSSSEAFGDEDERDRRVRQRIGNEDEIEHGLRDELAPEMGMDAVPALEDYHSSSMIPGSRPPSVVLSSVVRGAGSAQKGQPDPSPLFGRGKAVDLLQRYSDLPALASSDDFAQLHSQDYSVEDELGGFSNTLNIKDSVQDSAVSLDKSSAQFLGYTKDIALDEGYTRLGDHPLRHWVDF